MSRSNTITSYERSRGSVLQHRIDGGGEHRHIVVVRGEHHRHHVRVSGHQAARAYGDRLRMQEVHALQSLDLPMRAGALLVRDEDVEQPFRKMPHRTGGLHVHSAEIGGGCEFVEQREQPFVVFEEDVLPHDEHVAECRGSPIEHGIGVHLVVGMARAQNVIHVAQVLQTQVLVGIPMLLEIRESADAANVIQRRGDDVPTVHGTSDRIIVDTVFGERVIIDIRVDDLAVIVLFVRSIGEIEVPAVVAEAVIVGVLRFSRPSIARSARNTAGFPRRCSRLRRHASVSVKAGHGVRRAHLHRNNTVPLRGTWLAYAPTRRF